MKASIVIPVFNQLEYTEKCLSSIKKNTTQGAYEIIVINNGSTDRTAKFLKTQKVRVISNRKNQGVAKAWNQGVKKAKGAYVCIINNDIVVNPGWLEKLIVFYERTSNAGIVSPGTREGRMDYVEDFPDPHIPADWYFREYEKAMGNVREKGMFGWCMLIKRERFRQIGYFDETFRIGVGEDTDFYMRLKKAGFESWVTGSVFIHHFRSKTLNEMRKEKGPGFEDRNIAVLNERWGEGRDGYLARKWKSLKRFTRNVYLKVFFGHTLLEK